MENNQTSAPALMNITRGVLPSKKDRFITDRGSSYLRQRRICDATATEYGLFSCLVNWYDKKENIQHNDDEGLCLPNSDYTCNFRSISLKGFRKVTKYREDGTQPKHIPFGLIQAFFDPITLYPKETPPQWLFITEAEFDALTFVEYVQPAISIGGVGCLSRFFEVFKLKNINLPPVLISSFDNDEAGVKCFENFRELLSLNNYKGKLMNFWDYTRPEWLICEDNSQIKDINEFFVKNPCQMDETMRLILSEKCNSLVLYSTPTPVQVTKIDIYKRDPVPQTLSEGRVEDNDLNEDLTINDIEHITESGLRHNEFKRKFSGEQLMTRLKSRRNTKHQVLITPFDTLNRYLGGGFRCGLHFIGGSTGIGKTAFLLRLTEKFIEDGVEVTYYTYEVESEQIGARILSHLSFDEYLRKKQSNIISVLKNSAPENFQNETQNCYSNLEILEGSRYNPGSNKLEDLPLYHIEHIDRLVELMDKTYSSRLNVVDMSSFDVNETPTVDYIFNQVMDMYYETRTPPVVFIDYLQLIQPSFDMVYSSDKQIVDYSVRKLKQLATKTHGYFFVVTSLNRDSYNTAPTEKSSKETGLIEYMGDTLSVLSFVDGSSKKLENVELAEIKSKDVREVFFHTLKNRNGASGFVIQLNNVSRFGHFEDIGVWKNNELSQTPQVPVQKNTATLKKSTKDPRAEKVEQLRKMM